MDYETVDEIHSTSVLIFLIGVRYKILLGSVKSIVILHKSNEDSTPVELIGFMDLKSNRFYGTQSFHRNPTLCNLITYCSRTFPRCGRRMRGFV
jgi:hypothetical protein